MASDQNDNSFTAPTWDEYKASFSVEWSEMAYLHWPWWRSVVRFAAAYSRSSSTKKFRMGVLVIVVQAVVAFAARPTSAQDYDAGLQAYHRGDYYAAKQQWLPLALQGSSEAQYAIGELYQDGKGVEKNYEQAARWYQMSADQGNAFALFKLAYFHFDGLDRPKDAETGAKLLRRAADQGLADAQSDLGVKYMDGVGVPEDYAVAVSWFRKAAQGNHKAAWLNLGLAYKNGHGVPKDNVKAAMWLLLATLGRDDEVSAAAMPVYDEIARKLTTAQKDEHFRLAAERGHPEAQFNLGLKYDQGIGVPQNFDAAVKWYRLAAEQEFAPAQNNLGFMYKMGRGVPQDDAKALKLYRLAVAQRFVGAQFNLGFMYEEGRGVPQDYCNGRCKSLPR